MATLSFTTLVFCVVMDIFLVVSQYLNMSKVSLSPWAPSVGIGVVLGKPFLVVLATLVVIATQSVITAGLLVVMNTFLVVRPYLDRSMAVLLVSISPIGWPCTNARTTTAAPSTPKNFMLFEKKFYNITMIKLDENTFHLS